MAKYICEQCKKESDIPMECCGSPMKLVEETAQEQQQEPSSQEQPAAEAQSQEDASPEETPAEKQEDTSSA